MKSVYSLMENYFQDASVPSSKVLSERSELPVSPRQNRWVYDKNPEKLVGRFSFKKADSYAYFISSVADYEKKKSHHAKIVCSYPDVTLTVRTHDLQMVTKQDIKYTQEVLRIYKDALVLERTGNE